jgi:hypothetical protein
VCRCESGGRRPAAATPVSQPSASGSFSRPARTSAPRSDRITLRPVPGSACRSPGPVRPLAHRTRSLTPACLARWVSGRREARRRSAERRGRFHDRLCGAGPSSAGSADRSRWSSQADSRLGRGDAQGPLRTEVITLPQEGALIACVENAELEPALATERPLRELKCEARATHVQDMCVREAQTREVAGLPPEASAARVSSTIGSCIPSTAAMFWSAIVSSVDPHGRKRPRTHPPILREVLYVSPRAYYRRSSRSSTPRRTSLTGRASSLGKPLTLGDPSRSGPRFQGTVLNQD